MGHFTGSTTIDADADRVFAYMSEVRNLPRYFARMTSAEPGEGERITTTARMPDGTEVEGEAWFRATGESAEVAFQVHTTRVDDDDADAQQGIQQTLDSLRQQVERQ